MIRKFIIIFLLFFLVINLSEAATVHGNVYDFNLDLLEKAIVRVNSKPAQSVVSKNGVYSFNLNPGSYVLTAEYYEYNVLSAETSEEIKIEEEGDFVIDLILFPIIDDINDTDFDIDDPYGKSSIWYIWIIIVLVIILVAVLFIWKRPKKKNKLEVEDDLQRLIEIIKSNNGRTTQKEIRKVLGLSEAKVSLMITELEDKGIVKRIKRGRGNVVVLKK
jgi:uncharacterized membrane protein